MRGTGRLLQTWWDSRSRKTMIQFEVAGDVLPDCEKLGAKELDIRAYPVSKRRSLNANAYYWVLVGKMAEKLRISTARLHNLHLRECGYREMMGDQVVYVVIPDDQEEDVLERESFHLAQTSEVKWGKDDRLYRTYALLRGSHTFNREEMSRLIDTAVEGAKALDIETLTPDELRRMMEAYKNEVHH